MVGPTVVATVVVGPVVGCTVDDVVPVVGPTVLATVVVGP